MSRFRSELNPALHMFGDLWCPWGHAVLRAGWREDYTAHMLLPNTSWRREKANTESSLPPQSSGKEADPEIAPLQALVEMSKG